MRFHVGGVLPRQALRLTGGQRRGDRLGLEIARLLGVGLGELDVELEVDVADRDLRPGQVGDTRVAVGEDLVAIAHLVAVRVGQHRRGLEEVELEGVVEGVAVGVDGQRVAEDLVVLLPVGELVGVGVLVAGVDAELRLLLIGQAVAVGVSQMNIAGHRAAGDGAVDQYHIDHPAALLLVVAEAVAVAVNQGGLPVFHHRLRGRALESGRGRVDALTADQNGRGQRVAVDVHQVGDAHLIVHFVLRLGREDHGRAVDDRAAAGTHHLEPGVSDDQPARLGVDVLGADLVVLGDQGPVAHWLAELHDHLGVRG